MILQSSRDIVEQDGVKGLSARAIAKRIGYSPGTLYNVFANLDDLLLTIQVAVVDEATQQLRNVSNGGGARLYIKALADSYIGFALKNHRLWNLLFQHPGPAATRAGELEERYESMVALIREALTPAMRRARPEDLDQTARALWACLHGMSALAVAEKSTPMSRTAAPRYVSLLIDHVLGGLEKPSS